MQLNLDCPGCGRGNDTASAPDGAAPEEGDVSICWKCHTVAIFYIVDGATGTRLPNEEEALDLSQDPEIRRFLGAMTESYTPNQAMEMLQ